MATEHRSGGEGTDRQRRVPVHRQTGAFARRSAHELLHDRSALFWGLGMPVFFYVLLSGAFTGEGTGPELAAEAVAFGIFGTLTITLVTFAQTFTADLRVKRYRKLRSLPVSPVADLLGRFLAGYALSIASFAIVLGAGLVVGAEYTLRSPISPLVVLVAIGLFSLVGVAMAVLVATMLHDSGYVLAVSNLLLLGLFFLTGGNGLGPERAPGPITDAINFVPNALATRIAIAHVVPLDESTAALSPPEVPTDPIYVLVLASWSVVMIAIASAALDRTVYRGDGGE